jgi:hypothetical protein
LVVLLAPTQAQQNYLTQTYLATAQPLPAAPGTPPVPSTIASVNSATNIVAPSLNGTGTINTQTQWQLYIDRELETVTGVNGTIVQVIRGQGGTRAASHAAGAMVLAGHPNWFYVQDPGSLGVSGITAPSNEPCVLAAVVASPFVNIRTGAQWYCNPVSLVWTPGFNNPFLTTGQYGGTTASVAGATAIAFPVVKISGTNAITSFTFTGNGAIGLAGTATANVGSNGQFCIVPTGAFTTTATNNIGSAQTAVVGQEQCWQWSSTDGKWFVIP